MVKIKEIDFEIINGKWRSERIANQLGKYTYPILMTIIKDINDQVIEVPLSYNQIGEMLRRHIWLERINDWDAFREGYQGVVKRIINEAIEEAENTNAEEVRMWFEKCKKK